MSRLSERSEWFDEPITVRIGWSEDEGGAGGAGGGEEEEEEDGGQIQRPFA